MPERVVLKVAEAPQSDVGLGRARVDTKTRLALGIDVGEVVEITGKKATAAKLFRVMQEDEGKGIIRVDGLVRRNLGVSIGDKVEVRKAEVLPAERVTIAPIISEGHKISFGQGIENFVKRGLLKRPVTKGDVVIVPGIALMGGALPFMVIKVIPKGVVQIVDDSVIEMKEEPVREGEVLTPTVTYEEVGGLGEELLKVREMIELPLKHAELFERLGIEPPKGVLLYGPPGTGKTLIAKAVANEAGANFYAIQGPEVMCVTGETRILTNPDGLVEAQTLYEDAQGEVLRDDGVRVVKLAEPVTTFAFDGAGLRKSRITHVARLRAPTLRVRLGDGTRLTGSRNQPFLTFEDGRFIWRRLENLRIGDFVARVNRVPLPERSQPLLAPRSHPSRASIRFPRMSSPALWELVGLLVSEGSISEDAVTFCNFDPSLRAHYRRLVRDLFAVGTSLHSGGRVVVYRTALVDFVRQFGLAPGKKVPAVPAALYRARREEVAAFIRGLFEGDGTVSLAGKYVTPRIYSKSEGFLRDVQGILLLKLGIATILSDHPTPKGLMHALSCRGSQGRVRFATVVGAVTKEKRRRLALARDSGREHEHIPTPRALLRALRTRVPYRAHRGNDVYVYERFPFTRHALRKLYGIAEAHGAITEEVRAERDELLRTDVGWEQILEISPAGIQDLYDFTVDHDSFVASPYVLLHNSKYYGQSEERLREKFEEASKNAPSVLFIDELDSIAPKREEVTGEVERRVVAQLLTLMDGLQGRGQLIVIGATNREEAIDPALRRPGRFDREIEIGVPDRRGRKEILQIHTRGMPIEGAEEDKDRLLSDLANVSHGFVGADLAALCREAAMKALRRYLPEIDLERPIPAETLERMRVLEEDFKNALKEIEPSAMREVLVEVPRVNWADVGGLEDVKRKLREAVELPLKEPDAFTRMGIRPPRGILLYGPPGTGKTLLAKAVATESEANFISIKGPEVMSKWVGESEKAVRMIFKKAKQVAPCIVFLDELDSIAHRRGTGNDEGVSERVVNQLLTSLDGLESMEGVVVIGATNRPDMIDHGLLRTGRFDRLILVPIPDKKARLEILKVHSRGMPIEKDVDVEALADELDGYTGADIEGLCREAAMTALREDLKSNRVFMRHFEEARKSVPPSIDEETVRFYERIGQELQRGVAKKKEEIVYFR